MEKSVVLILFFCIICCAEKSESNDLHDENSNAVSDVQSISNSRYSTGNSLIDAVYSKMIKDDQDLKSFDKEVNLLISESKSLLGEKGKVLLKPTEFYSEVHNITGSIIDPTLKKELSDFVSSKSENYNQRNKDFFNVQKDISANNLKIIDHYNFYKIRKTLPEIQKYQDQNPLELDELKKMIDDQNKLLEQVKNLK